MWWPDTKDWIALAILVGGLGYMVGKGCEYVCRHVSVELEWRP